MLIISRWYALVLAAHVQPVTSETSARAIDRTGHKRDVAGDYVVEDVGVLFIRFQQASLQGKQRTQAGNNMFFFNKGAIFEDTQAHGNAELKKLVETSSLLAF